MDMADEEDAEIMVKYYDSVKGLIINGMDVNVTFTFVPKTSRLVVLVIIISIIISSFIIIG